MSEGHGVVAAAKASSWTWTEGQPGQPNKDVPNHVGDCSDAVESWERQGAGNTGAKATANEKHGTGFSKSTNYRSVGADEAIHPGDAVVYYGGKHVGVATGKYRTRNGVRQWQVWQNGTTYGTGQDWVARENASGVYRRQVPQ